MQKRSLAPANSHLSPVRSGRQKELLAAAKMLAFAFRTTVSSESSLHVRFRDFTACPKVARG